MKLHLHFPRARWLAPLCLLLLAAGCPAWAQQDTADRLWRGAQQQSRRQAAPAPLGAGGQDSLDDSALMQTPEGRLRQLTLAVLNAVNQRNWFGADRLLRQYARVPGHDPALATFVAASRRAAEGDYAGAIAGYESVLQANPRFTRGALDLARALYADNRLRDARAAFERLRAQPLPPEVDRHINEYLRALAQRRRTQLSLSVAAVREDNVNGASTVVEPCALIFLGVCLPNNPGRKIADNGVYFEASLNRLWPLAGHHGLMLRSINYGNHYRRADEHDNLVSTTYLGYQYASARNQFQFLPLFEYDREGGRTVYRALGVRLGFTRQLGERAQVEASLEAKARRFSPLFKQNLQGDFRALTLFGQYALAPDLLAYGSLAWRGSDARQPIFAHRERAARLGLFKSFGGRVTLNLAYGWRQRRARAVNAVFGRRQHDREGSLYLNLSLPGHRWQGLTPVLTYEYRNNRSSIPHAYGYEKSRVTLGFNKVF